MHYYCHLLKCSSKEEEGEEQKQAMENESTLDRGDSMQRCGGVQRTHRLIN